MKHLYRLAAGLLVCAGSETFDVGIDLGSTVSLDYMERRPFRFDGRIEAVEVRVN
jgi:arylsulfatase